jgi:hypothetical protein
VGGACGTHGNGEKAYKFSVEKPEEKRPFARPRCRWEDGIRMDLRDSGLGCVQWIQLADVRDRWRAVVNAVMNLRVLAPQSYLYYRGEQVYVTDQGVEITCWFVSRIL